MTSKLRKIPPEWILYSNELHITNQSCKIKAPLLFQLWQSSNLNQFCARRRKNYAFCLTNESCVLDGNRELSLAASCTRSLEYNRCWFLLFVPLPPFYSYFTTSIIYCFILIDIVSWELLRVVNFFGLNVVLCKQCVFIYNPCNVLRQLYLRSLMNNGAVHKKMIFK